MNKEEIETYIEVNSNGITLSGDTKFLEKENKVFINNHEITDMDTFFKVAEENTKLQQENKQLNNNWDKLRDYLFDIRQRGFELQNLAGIHNTEPSIAILMILDKMQELENGDSNG